MWWEDGTFVLALVTLSRDWDGTSSIKCSGEWFFSLLQPLDTGQDAVVSSLLMLGILELLALICRSAGTRTWNERQLPLNMKYLTIYSSFVNNTSGLRHTFPWQRVSLFPASLLHLQQRSSALCGYSTSLAVHFNSLLNGAGSSNLGNKCLNLGPPTLPSVKCWIAAVSKCKMKITLGKAEIWNTLQFVEHWSVLVRDAPELSCGSIVCVSLSKTLQLKW